MDILSKGTTSEGGVKNVKVKLYNNYRCLPRKIKFTLMNLRFQVFELYLIGINDFIRFFCLHTFAHITIELTCIYSCRKTLSPIVYTFSDRIIHTNICI